MRIVRDDSVITPSFGEPFFERLKKMTRLDEWFYPSTTVAEVHNNTRNVSKLQKAYEKVLDCGFLPKEVKIFCTKDAKRILSLVSVSKKDTISRSWSFFVSEAMEGLDDVRLDSIIKIKDKLYGFNSEIYSSSNAKVYPLRKLKGLNTYFVQPSVEICLIVTDDPTIALAESYYSNNRTGVRVIYDRF